MNNKISTYIGLALLTAFASCADDKFADFQTEKPESLTQYEYLNAYDNLKSYIDRSAHPGFKLGAGVSADDFLKGELVRSMVISNFDEITAGNAMKYASCVSDNGIMDFSKVSKFVEAAKAAGVTIYGRRGVVHHRVEKLDGRAIWQFDILPPRLHVTRVTVQHQVVEQDFNLVRDPAQDEFVGAGSFQHVVAVSLHQVLKDRPNSADREYRHAADDNHPSGEDQ